METKKAELNYQQIVAAISAFDRLIGWVRDGDLVFDLNYTKSMHEEVKTRIEETRDEITEKYQRTTADGRDLFEAPDGRLVVKNDRRFEYAREVEGEPHTEGTELRPTGIEYIKDEDREHVIQNTPQGPVTRADQKQRKLRIAPTDQDEYEDELSSLNDRTFSVAYVPIDPSDIRDPEKIDDSRSVDYSDIMHIFEGVDVTPTIEDEGVTENA